MKRILLLVISIFLLSGCASILSGQMQAINIYADNGKTVTADVITAGNIQTVTLPTKLIVRRSNEVMQIIVQEKDNPCYNQTMVAANTSINPMFFINFVSGGVLGTSTDLGTGAIWQYDSAIVVPTNAKQNAQCE